MSRIINCQTLPDISGFPAAKYTVSSNTNAWTTGSYTELVSPGTLNENFVYGIKIYYNKVGLENVVQSWVVPISVGYSASVGVGNDLSGSVSIFNLNSGRFFKLRHKVNGSSSISMGLEAAMTTNDMNSGSITLTVTPLF